MREVISKIRAYLVTFTLLNLGLGLAVAGALHVLGVDFPAALGAFTGLASFVPYVGQIVSGVVVVLRRGNVPFSETYARPLVVLPVYHEGDIAVLWDEPNPWLSAWRDLPPADGLQPLMVPLGDLSDMKHGGRRKLGRVVERERHGGLGDPGLFGDIVDRDFRHVRSCEQIIACLIS